jgi:hypothetical protein
MHRVVTAGAHAFAVVLACAALNAWAFDETLAVQLRTSCSATFMRFMRMEIFLGLLSIAVVGFVLIRRFEQRLQTQRGPWIAEQQN